MDKDQSDREIAQSGAIVGSSDDAIIGKSPDGRITSWNRSAETLFGYTRVEAVGQPIRLIVPDDRMDEDEALLSRLQAGERIEHFETVRKHRTGGRLDVTLSASPIHDQRGEVSGVSETIRSLSRARHAERAGALLAAIVDSSDDAVVSKNLNSVITSWNKGAERIFGWSADEAVGQSILLLIPPELHSQEDEIISKIKVGERIQHFVTERVRKDGARVNVSITISPVRNPQGEIVGASKIARDVTEETKGEARRAGLIRLTDAIRDLEDADEIAYQAARILGETLKVSRAGYGLIDVARETITIERDWNAPGIRSLAGTLRFRDYGSYIEDLARGETVVFADAEKDPRTMASADALKAISAQAVVNMPVTERGEFVALLYLNHETARLWPEGELAFIREVAERTRTATERARVTKALRELNEQLETRVAEALAEQRLLADILESTDAFVQVADPNFIWLAVNRAGADEFARIYGVRPRVGENMLAMLAHLPEEQAALRQVWSRALRGEAFTEIAEFGTTDEDRRYHEMKFNPLYNDQGQVIGAYQFVFDVTDRVQDQIRLQQAEAQLRQAQKMEAVGQLTGGVAHDFNNMLAVISGALQLLDRRVSQDDARAKTLIASASDAARRAGSLTQRLLAFSRQQPLKPEVIDPNKLVAGMTELFRHSLGANINLETVLAGGLWRICADQNQLENVLLNLAVNARDAMPDHGRLTIETQNAALDSRYVAAEAGLKPGQYVLIAVTDTGCGMPPEVIAKAFDPFFTTKAVGKGTGLGLSQVYGFIKQSGGHIRIYSEPGQGTSVKLYLPRHIGDASADADESVEAALPQGEDQELILVVDDEDLVRQMSVAALTELGYRVLEAGSALAALTLLAERDDIDLLFTDIVMPDMDGRRLVDAMRETRPDLPVIYTTGYTRNAVVHNGVLDPGVELIGKPFTLEDLALRVRAVLDRRTNKG
ncbi:MAG: PAS domain S-box protein [Asticcacaulis sp.]|uniref:PAS domain S-box protein n=1 Tax=Asticcacaulis sp. TaxID=1872648 RepID=UPI003F7B374A